MGLFCKSRNVEYRPVDGNIFNTNPVNWNLVVPQPVPYWFHRPSCIDKMWELLAQRRKRFVHDSLTPPIIISDGEHHHIRNSTVLLQKGIAHLYGHSAVQALGKSGVVVTALSPQILQR